MLKLLQLLLFFFLLELQNTPAVLGDSTSSLSSSWARYEGLNTGYVHTQVLPAANHKGLSSEWALFRKNEIQRVPRAQEKPLTKASLFAQKTEVQGMHEAAKEANTMAEGNSDSQESISAAQMAKPVTKSSTDTTSMSASQAFDSEKAASILETYVGMHKSFASSVLSWEGFGVLILILAVTMLVFSEIRVVLVVREQDFRKKMIDGGQMEYSSGQVKDLERKEANSQAARPYVTMGSMILLFVGLGCVLKPLCDVLDVIGLPSSGCFLNVGFGALVGSVTLTTFTMGCCWSCTRGWASLVMFSIALSGGIFCTSGIPFLAVLWMLGSISIFLYYFVYLPESQDPPFWCQKIGPMKASMNPEDWKKAAASSAEASLEDFKKITFGIPGADAFADAAIQVVARQSPTDDNVEPTQTQDATATHSSLWSRATEPLVGYQQADRDSREVVFALSTSSSGRKRVTV
uniref:Uncharacterized protein n=1 Tax=Hanusia phi TaxID=3032 RepID=A0A7S0EFA4_9CRYP|mmetsp:Transcript_23317/g.52372  ORF Transcript_23317/g.52372 Transcript_23317/m.52372 type:complete len:462 (+) Transcript_23317:67-1452(+)